MTEEKNKNSILNDEGRKKIEEEEKLRTGIRNKEEKKKKKEESKNATKGCLVIIAIVVMFIVLFNIGDDTPSKKQESTEKASTVYSINQDVRVGDVRWKLVSVKNRGNILKASESRYSTIAENKTTSGKFVEVTMEVENLNSEMKSVSSLKLIDDKDREFICATDVSEWIPKEKEMFFLSNLNPNMPQQFTEIYEIPTDATGLKVKVGDLSLWGTEEALIRLPLVPR